MKIIKLKNSNVFFGSPIMKYSKSCKMWIPNYTTNIYEAACISESEFQELIQEIPLKSEFLELIDSELAQ